MDGVGGLMFMKGYEQAGVLKADLVIKVRPRQDQAHRTRELLKGMQHPGLRCPQVLEVGRLFADDFGPRSLAYTAAPFTLKSWLVYSDAQPDQNNLNPVFQAKQVAMKRNSVFTQLLSAVRHLHKNRLLHLDIKPSNIIACEQKSDRQGVITKLHLQLADWDTLKQVDKPCIRTSVSCHMGTTGYRCPSQDDRAPTVGEGCDWYSLLAVMVYVHSTIGREEIARYQSTRRPGDKPKYKALLLSELSESSIPQKWQCTRAAVKALLHAGGEDVCGAFADWRPSI